MNSWGRITLWPRLEIGKSSVRPWIKPRTMAWKMDITPIRINQSVAKKYLHWQVYKRIKDSVVRNHMFTNYFIILVKSDDAAVA